MVLEITSKDYINLQNNYSDLNIIKRIQGSEFLVDNASVVDFDIQASSSITSDGLVTPTYPPLDIPQFVSSWAEVGFTLLKRRVHGRVELYSIVGYFTAKIDEVIYDKNNISVDYQIDYDSYYSENELIVADNYQSIDFIYNAIRNNDNLVNKDIDNNRIPQIIDNANFNIDEGSVAARFLWINIYKTIKPYVYSSVKVDNIVTDTLSGETTVRIRYEIPLWYGRNEYETRYITNTFKNYLNVVKTIMFNVRANTINVVENTFDYGDFSEEPYAFESNEFLQYENGESIEDKLSYNVAQNIFDKTEINRIILRFDLLRLEKLDWDDNGELRYIASRDRFRIKDELGNYIGQYYNDNGDLITPEFEVIRANGRWDGSFYKEIVAKQIMEDS